MLFHLHWKLEVCPDQLLTTHFVTTHVPPPQISQVIFAIKIPFLNASLHFHFPVFSPFLDILDKVLCLSFYDLPYLLAADTAFFPPFTGSESISLSQCCPVHCLQGFVSHSETLFYHTLDLFVRIWILKLQYSQIFILFFCYSVTYFIFSTSCAEQRNCKMFIIRLDFPVL